MLLYTSRDRPTDLNTLVLILLDLDFLNLHELNTTSTQQVPFDLPYAAWTRTKLIYVDDKFKS
jgi:hypothetical protein